jgi:hypothetical protein
MTRILYALAFLVAMSVGLPCFAQGTNLDFNGQYVTGLQGYPGASTAPLSGQVWMYNSPTNRYVPVYPADPSTRSPGYRPATRRPPGSMRS